MHAGTGTVINKSGIKQYQQATRDRSKVQPCHCPRVLSFCRTSIVHANTRLSLSMRMQFESPDGPFCRHSELTRMWRPAWQVKTEGGKDHPGGGAPHPRAPPPQARTGPRGPGGRRRRLRDQVLRRGASTFAAKSGRMCAEAIVEASKNGARSL